MKRFNLDGYIQAKKLVNEIQRAGGQAKIAETWMDYGAGIAWETVLVYSRFLSRWCQGLNPADFDAMNRGERPIYHDEILKLATHQT
ncbi:hypothetical protein [Metabacillus sp. SLBN-84]